MLKQTFDLIKLMVIVTIDRSFFVDDEKRAEMKSVVGFLQKFLLTSEHLSDEEILAYNPLDHMHFLMGRDDGILLPLPQCRNFRGKLKRSYPLHQPTPEVIPELILDLGYDDTLPNLAVLRHLWLEDEPHLYRHGGFAPVVRSQDLVRTGGRLYVDLVPTLFGRWRKRRFWYLKTSIWRDKTFAGTKIPRPVGALRTHLRYLWRCLKPVRTP